MTDTWININVDQAFPVCNRLLDQFFERRFPERKGQCAAEAASVQELQLERLTITEACATLTASLVCKDPEDARFRPESRADKRPELRPRFRVVVGMDTDGLINLSHTCTCGQLELCGHVLRALQNLIDSTVSAMAALHHSKNQIEFQRDFTTAKVERTSFPMLDKLNDALEKLQRAAPHSAVALSPPESVKLDALESVEHQQKKLDLANTEELNMWLQRTNVLVQPLLNSKPQSTHEFGVVFDFSRGHLKLQPVYLTGSDTVSSQLNADPMPKPDFNGQCKRNILAAAGPLRQFMQDLLLRDTGEHVQNWYEFRGIDAGQMLNDMLSYSCYFKRVSAATRYTHAQTRQCTLQWRVNPDGMHELALQIDKASGLASSESPSSGLQIIVFDQLWYLDTAERQIGRLEGVPAHSYSESQVLPPVRPKNLHWLGEKLITENKSYLPHPLALRTVRSVGKLLAKIVLLKGISSQTSDSSANNTAAELTFEYAPIEATAINAPQADTLADGKNFIAPDNGASTVSRRHGDVYHVLERDIPAEQQAIDSLQALGLARFSEFNTRSAVSAKLANCWIAPSEVDAARYSYRATAWHAMLAPLKAAGFDVRYDPSFGLEFVTEARWYADLNEAAGHWFELELGVELEGVRTSMLPILLKAFRTHNISLQAGPLEAPNASILVPLDGKRYISILLSQLRNYIAPIIEWVEKLENGKVRLPAIRAPIAQELMDVSVTVRSAESLGRLNAVLTNVRDPNRTRTPVPAGLKATLRSYQADGLDWLDFLGENGLGGLLADDMGLGKTIQVLAHLLSERAKNRLPHPALVVMPTSLVPNWQAEAAKFAPELRVLVLHGSDRADRLDLVASSDLVLTTYPLLARDQVQLAKKQFSVVIYDEAQAIKNAKTFSAQAARNIPAARRLVMTGTPVENHLGELWAQVDLVLPGLLGLEKSFRENIRNPIEKEGSQAQLTLLSKRLRPFMLRRTKAEVASDLPLKTEITRTVALDGAQRELYETLRLAMHEKVRETLKNRGIAQSSIIVLDALLKLRQVCCDPALVKLPSARNVKTSAKRTLLLEMLAELLAEGRRVLIFSQFTEMLNLIEADLKREKMRYTRLDGSTKDRKTPVEQFQSGTLSIMLISLKAGGAGLNLTAADTVIHYDPWWNPAVENQATDRAHRIGQDKPVFVYKLVCQDTVEDRIVAMQAQKTDLAEAILSGGSSKTLQWDEAAIAHLFSN